MTLMSIDQPNLELNVTPFIIKEYIQLTLVTYNHLRILKWSSF